MPMPFFEQWNLQAKPLQWGEAAWKYRKINSRTRIPIHCTSNY